MSYASLLIHKANVQRTVQTADGTGGFTTAESTIMRRVPCRFNAMGSPQLAVYADRLGTLAGFVIFVEGNRDIREGDVMIKADDSRQFDVLLKKDYDEQKRMLTLICSERARRVE